MGKTDTITKDYVRNKVVFADAFNKYLYHGRQVLDPENLRELDGAELVLPYGGEGAAVPEQRYRDALKLMMTDGSTAYCILGIENQSDVHYAMPVRNMVYDSLQLARQVTEAARAHKQKGDDTGQHISAAEFLSGFYRTDRLLPVVTLVIFFGSSEWDAPLSLREMYSDAGEEVLRYAPDYHVNLIVPSQLVAEELEEFHSGLKEVMIFHKYAKNKEKLREAIQKDTKFRNLDRETVEVINATANANLKYDENEEAIDVCVAIDEMMEDSRQEGKIELLLEMGFSVDEIAKRINVLPETVLEIMERRSQKN